MIESLAMPAMALVLLAGHFAPWVAHKTAALTLSAHELAVFTHYTPGAGVFLNQWFYLPLWVAALFGAFLAGGLVSRVNRLIAAVGCAVVASLGMPGYPQVLTAFRNPDYQLQFFISIAVIGAIFAVVLWRASPRQRLRLRWILVLALMVAAAVPLGGYLAIKPAVEQLYNERVGIGAGWWLTLIALAPGLLSLLRIRRK
jgi:hypothetical protein